MNEKSVLICVFLFNLNDRVYKKNESINFIEEVYYLRKKNINFSEKFNFFLISVLKAIQKCITQRFVE